MIDNDDSHGDWWDRGKDPAIPEGGWLGVAIVIAALFLIGCACYAAWPLLKGVLT